MRALMLTWLKLGCADARDPAALFLGRARQKRPLRRGRDRDRRNLGCPFPLVWPGPLSIQKQPDVGLAGADRTSHFEAARTVFVEGFGCRPMAAMRLAPWPASGSLQ
jgi:hypothetical protein